MDAEVEESSEDDLQPRTSMRPTPAPFCQPPFTPSVPDVSLIFNDDRPNSNSSRNVFKDSSPKPPAVVATNPGLESYNAWKHKNSKALQESAKESSKNFSPTFKHHSPLPNYSSIDHYAGNAVTRNPSTNIVNQSESTGVTEQNVKSGQNVLRKDTDISFGMAPLQPVGYAIPKHGIPTDSFQQLRSPNHDQVTQSSKSTPLMKNYNTSNTNKANNHIANREPHHKTNAYESYLNTTGKSHTEHSQQPVINSSRPLIQQNLSASSDYSSKGNRGLHLPSDIQPAPSANSKPRFGTARTINYVETYQQVQNLPVPRKQIDLDRPNEPQYSNREIRQQVQNYHQFTSPLSYQNYPSEYGNRFSHENSLDNRPLPRSRHSLANDPYSTNRISEDMVQPPYDIHLPHSAPRDTYSRPSSLPNDSAIKNQSRERFSYASGGNRLQDNSGSVTSAQFSNYGDVALSRKSKATVQDLFKIVQLQNEQLQILQAQVAQLLRNQIKQNHESPLQDYSRNDGAETGNPALVNTSRSVGEDSTISGGLPNRLATRHGDNGSGYNPNIYRKASDTQADSYCRPKQTNPQFATNAGDLHPRKNMLHRSNGGNVPSFVNSQTNTSLLWDKNVQFSVLGNNVETIDIEPNRFIKPTNISTVCQKVSIGVMTSFIDPMFGNAAGSAVQQIHETRQEFMRRGPHAEELVDNDRLHYDDTLPQQSYNNTKKYRGNDTHPEQFDNVENQTRPTMNKPNQHSAYEHHSSNKTRAREEFAGLPRNTQHIPLTAIDRQIREIPANPKDSRLLDQPMRQGRIPSDNRRQELLSQDGRSYVHQNAPTDNRVRSSQGNLEESHSMPGLVRERQVQGNPEESHSTPALVRERQMPADGLRQDEHQNHDYRLVDAPRLSSENNRRHQMNVEHGAPSGGQHTNQPLSKGVTGRYNPRCDEELPSHGSRKVVLTPETRLKDLWAEKEDYCRPEARTSPIVHPGTRSDRVTLRQDHNFDERYQATSSNVHHCPDHNERLPADRADSSERRSDDHRCPEPSSDATESGPRQQEDVPTHTINVLEGLERLAPFESLSDQVDESLDLASLNMDHLADRRTTPVPSVRISMGEYKMSDGEEDTSLEGGSCGGDNSDEDDGERVGWTFYHNMMGQVNQMLNPAAAPPNVEQPESPPCNEHQQGNEHKHHENMTETLLGGEQQPAGGGGGKGDSDYKQGENIQARSIAQASRTLSEQPDGEAWQPTANRPVDSQGVSSPCVGDSPDCPSMQRATNDRNRVQVAAPENSGHPAVQKVTIRELVEQCEKENNQLMAERERNRQLDSERDGNREQDCGGHDHSETRPLHPGTEDQREAVGQCRDDREYQRTVNLRNHSQQPREKNKRPPPAQHHRSRYDQFVEGRGADGSHNVPPESRQQGEQAGHNRHLDHSSGSERLWVRETADNRRSQSPLTTNQCDSDGGRYIARDGAARNARPLHLDLHGGNGSPTSRQGYRDQPLGQDHLNNGSPYNARPTNQQRYQDQSLRHGHPDGDSLRTSQPLNQQRYHESSGHGHLNRDSPHNTQAMNQRYHEESSGHGHPNRDSPHIVQSMNQQRYHNESSGHGHRNHDSPHNTQATNQQRYQDQRYKHPDSDSLLRTSQALNQQGYYDESSGHGPPNHDSPHNTQATNQQRYQDQRYGHPDSDSLLRTSQTLNQQRYHDESSGRRPSNHDSPQKSQPLNQQRHHDQAPRREHPDGDGPRTMQRGYLDQSERTQAGGGRHGGRSGERSSDSVRQATMEQLQQMGISFYDQGGGTDRDDYYAGRRAAPASVPRVNLTDVNADVSESSDISMRMNALALKYLKDDQLSEYTRLTTNTGSSGEGMTVCNIATKSTNLSFATLSYLERYQLIPPSQHPQGN